LQRAVLKVTEGVLPGPIEDRRDGAIGLILYDPIQINERQSKEVGQLLAHRGFARPHESK
jgi:hypothetical protein